VDPRNYRSKSCPPPLDLVRRRVRKFLLCLSLAITIHPLIKATERTGCSGKTDSIDDLYAMFRSLREARGCEIGGEGNTKKSDKGKKGGKKGVFFCEKAHHNQTQHRSPIGRHCRKGRWGREISLHEGAWHRLWASLLLWIGPTWCRIMEDLSM
jgi:hypothetical protein